MKINNLNPNTVSIFSLLLALGIVVASCNKDIPKATPLAAPLNYSTVTISGLLDADTSLSFYKAAATRVGMISLLNNPSNDLTVFLPNNAAFRVSGISSIAMINALPITSVGGIVGYSIVPGRQYSTDGTTNVSAAVPNSFPNIQLPTSVTIGALPGTTIPLKLSTFLSKRSNGFWDNNIPIVTPDLLLENGIVHIVAGIVAPPSQVLKSAMYSDPNLTYFKAAIARADSGMSGLNKLDSLLGYAVTNMTVLAPNDAAFKNLIFGSVYGYLTGLGVDPATAAGQATALSSSPAVFSNPALFGVLTAATVRGILAYHFLATPNPSTGAFEPNIRVFSVNFSSTANNYTTLVNSFYAIHPGIKAQATFYGPFVTSLQFTGYGTFPPGGAPYSGTPANAVKMDQHAVNGVYHIIDQVLLPQ